MPDTLTRSPVPVSDTVLSPKQLLLHRLEDHLYQMVIASGCIRSGKTWSGLSGLMRYCTKRFESKMIGVACMSMSMWYGAISETVHAYAKASGRPVKFTKDFFEYGGNRYERIAANNISSVARVQGLNLVAVFATQTELMPQELLQAFSGRTALIEPEHRKLVYDCNPKNSQHWFKVNYIDRAEDMNALVLEFTPEDNPLMTPEKWSQIKSEYIEGTPEYNRDILGLWSDGIGVIFDLDHYEAIKGKPAGKPTRLDVCVDHASSSVTHATLFARYGDAYWAIDEWRYDVGDKSQVKLRDGEQIPLIVKEFAKWEHKFQLPIARWVVDVNPPNFRLELEHLGKKGLASGRVYDCVKDDQLWNIRLVNYMLGKTMLRVDARCKHLIRECSGWFWDEAAADKSRDKPAEGNDHGPDTLCYWANMIARTENINVGEVRMY